MKKALAITIHGFILSIGSLLVFLMVGKESGTSNWLWKNFNIAKESMPIIGYILLVFLMIYFGYIFMGKAQ